MRRKVTFPTCTTSSRVFCALSRTAKAYRGYRPVTIGRPRRPAIASTSISRLANSSSSGPSVARTTLSISRPTYDPSTTNSAGCAVLLDDMDVALRDSGCRNREMRGVVSPADLIAVAFVFNFGEEGVPGRLLPDDRERRVIEPFGNPRTRTGRIVDHHSVVVHLMQQRFGPGMVR